MRLKRKIPSEKIKALTQMEKCLVSHDFIITVFCNVDDLWHFTNRINRKILAHTLAFWINRHSFHPLQFEQIISD